jgi:Uma2 family endonuclease
MAGASPRHVIISTNLLISLGSRFKGRPCLAYSSDLRVNVSASGDYLYPDATAVCGTPRFSGSYKDNLLNPTLIVEVLAESSAAYDHCAKFEIYRRLDSLQEYLLVAQDRYYLEHFHRQPDNTWLLTVIDDPAASLRLPSLECSVAVAEIYDKVEFA